MLLLSIIVYFDSEENLRITHFVSETNQDPTNPAGKSWKHLKN